MNRRRSLSRQRGVALIALVLMLFLVLAHQFYGAFNARHGKTARQEKTRLALAKAKEALIAYAVSADGTRRPGSLPCPDLTNTGKKGVSCGTAGGGSPAARTGRLPWRDLGIDDLQDGDGEKLWYIVSNNFKENTPKNPLNSDTTGTINVVHSLNTTEENILAVIIAPGAPIARQGSNTFQDRAASPLDPESYLDKALGIDNAHFDDRTGNGSILAGPIVDAGGTLLVNDTLILITYDDLMPLLEKRIARQVLQCLTEYAAYQGNGYDNRGRYPWPAGLAASAAGNYTDEANLLFGRLPDIMTHTTASASNMTPNWGQIPSCPITNGWFKDNNWREQVFYAVADAHKPATAMPLPCSAMTCLTVDGQPNQKVVIALARKMVSGQARVSIPEKALYANYLEGQQPAARNFVTSSTDIVLFSQ